MKFIILFNKINSAAKLFRFLSGSSPKRVDRDRSGEENGRNSPQGETPHICTINNNNNNHDEDNVLNNCENQPLDSTTKRDSHTQSKQVSSSQLGSETINESNENHEIVKPQHETISKTATTTARRVKHQNKENKQSQHHSHPTTIEPSLLLTATDYKNAGNKLCSLYRYEEALAHYSKAISKNPLIAIFFSNRALCHLKLQQFNQASQDCRRALELDPNLIKAHFFLGQALAELNNFDDSLKHLQRAHEIAREKKMNFGDDIAYQIRLTRRRRWNQIEDDTARLESELQKYLVDLIENDRKTKLGHLKNRLSSGANIDSQTWQPTASCSSLQTNSPGGATQIVETSQESEIISKCDKYIDKLNTMFNNLKLQRKGREVPDYLCGKISFEIMHDPVITPSGITYDRQDIEEHLKRVGHFDPITRQPLEANQLISNLAMKEVVDAYLNENEWALYH